VCCYKSCNSVIANFKSILCILDEEIELQKDKDVAQAIGLLSTVKNRKFVVYLFVLNDILTIINILSTQLQSKSTTLGKYSSLMCGVIDTLKNNRSDVYFVKNMMYHWIFLQRCVIIVIPIKIK